MTMGIEFFGKLKQIYIYIYIKTKFVYNKERKVTLENEFCKKIELLQNVKIHLDIKF